MLIGIICTTLSSIIKAADKIARFYNRQSRGPRHCTLNSKKTYYTETIFRDVMLVIFPGMSLKYRGALN